MKKVLFAAVFGLAFTAQAQSIKEGVKFLDNEQYAHARKTFSELVKQVPTAENYYYLGKFYLETEKLDSAFTSFTKGKEADPKVGLNYVGLGTIQWSKKDTVTANANFEQAISLRKREASVYYEIADVLLSYDVKNVNKAIENLNKAILYSKGGNAEYFSLLGDAYLLKGDGTSAAENYNKAIAVDGKSAKGYINKGNLYIRGRNYTEALKLYDQGIAVEPGYAPAYRQRAELYFLAQQYEKGLASYKKYMELSDEDFDTRLRYAKYLFKTKDYKEATPYLEGLTKEAPDNYLVYRLLGYSYLETNDYAKGFTSMDNFFKKVDQSKLIASDYEYLGKAQIRSGKDTVDGIANLRKAMELDTADNYLHQDLANLFYQKKQYADAAAEFEAVLAKGKPTTTDYLNLGKSYYILKDYVMADSAFGRMVKAKPTVANGYIWKCRSLVQTDPEYKTGAIKPYAEKYIEIVGKQPEASRNKKEQVEIYAFLALNSASFEKDKAKAKEYWSKALEIDPNNTAAKEQLASLK